MMTLEHRIIVILQSPLTADLDLMCIGGAGVVEVVAGSCEEGRKVLPRRQHLCERLDEEVHAEEHIGAVHARVVGVVTIVSLDGPDEIEQLGPVEIERVHEPALVEEVEEQHAQPPALRFRVQVADIVVPIELRFCQQVGRWRKLNSRYRGSLHLSVFLGFLILGDPADDFSEIPPVWHLELGGFGVPC
eukprot:5271343-Prymnesium_polylepis.1